jgi:alpha-mannosidase
VPYVYDENGNQLKSQQVKEESMLNLDWRKKVVFEGSLKPLGVTRFTIKTKLENSTKKQATKTSLDEVLKDNALLNEPIVVQSYLDTADPWGMSKEELTKMGKDPKDFRLMTEVEAKNFSQVESDLEPVRIIENGEVYTEIESLYTLDNSSAILRYKLYKNMPYIDVKLVVEYSDKNKLIRLKIKLPDSFKDGKTVGDGPYVWEEKPASEVTFQKWFGKQNNTGEIFAVINDGVYAGKCENGYLYLTLLRGAGYCFHPIGKRPLYPQDRCLNRIECGRYTYNIRIFRGGIIEVFKQAEELNNLPYAMNFFPVGEKNKTLNNVNLSGNVILTSIMPKEDKYVFRIYNPSNFEEEFTLSFINGKTTAIAPKHAVISVEYENSKFNVLTDKITY